MTDRAAVDALIVSLQAECVYMQGVGHGMAADKLHQAAAALEQSERLLTEALARIAALEQERDALRKDVKRLLGAATILRNRYAGNLEPDAATDDLIKAVIDAAIAASKEQG